VTFAFQKVNTTDLVLKDWKRYLDPTEKAIFESELSDYAWYSVVENNKVIAVFQIINVLDQYSKNLKIIFHPDFKEDESDIVGIILFIYKSMLDICDEKKIKTWMKRNLKKKTYTKLLSHLPSTQKYRVVHSVWAIKRVLSLTPL
jgi:hypothetical protein